MTVVQTANSTLGSTHDDAGGDASGGAPGGAQDGTPGGAPGGADGVPDGSDGSDGSGGGADAATGPAGPAPAVRCEPEPGPRRPGGGRHTISEVACITGMSAHTLRWYERIGLMPHVDRSNTGQRRFSDRDLDWLAFVGKLRLTGMPVADMVRYAELVRAGRHTTAERRALLEATRLNVRRRIAELQDTLAVLDYKIAGYTDAERVPERTAL